jgi:potassium-transporting ATPase ATP-binding subunit
VWHQPGRRATRDDAQSILRRNIASNGVGGIIAPFLGTKLIDLVVSALGVH